MLKKFAFAALIAAAPLTAPVAAIAEAGPQDDMFSALSACMVGLGDASAVEKAITGFGWTKGETADGVTDFVAPNGATETALAVSEDGKTCALTSTAVSVADAKTMTQAVMEAAGVKAEDVTKVTDDYGCDALSLTNGDTVSVVSGDETPVCDGANSQVIVSRK